MKKMFFLLLTTLIMLLGPPLLAVPLAAEEVIDYVTIEPSQGVSIIAQQNVDPEVPLIEIVGFCWDSETSCGETRIFIIIQSMSSTQRADLSFWPVFQPGKIPNVDISLSDSIIGAGDKIPIGALFSTI